MNTLLSFVSRHSLVLFFALAYTLSWAGNLFEWHSIFPLGPFLAALLVLSLTTGKAGLADFLSRIVRWRVGVRWYALVIGLPITIVGVAIGVNLLLGAQLAPTFQMPPLADLVASGYAASPVAAISTALLDAQQKRLAQVSKRDL